MARPKYTLHCKCAADGCAASTRYEYDTRSDYMVGARRNMDWKCTRHSHPEEVLSQDDLTKTITHELVQLDHGRYWGGGSGFIYGPGFKAYGADFPAGTKIRVTAEIILPDA